MIRTVTIALLCSTAASAALAGNADPAPAEPVVYTPPPVVKPFWEGGYVGAQLGYAYGEFDLGGSFDNDSVIGGLTAGYLWSLGNNWYLGPEFQYDWADVSITDPGTGQTASFDSMARLKLIAGYEMGNGLLYGSLGYAYSDFDGVGNFFNDSGDSYVVGLGYDWRVGENWTVGAEYMYHSFDSIGNGGGDVDVNTIHIKTSYRF
ncbi:MAG: outer membrane protein [Heliomarina sp.]|uniref:outer membrane protein n=1 Tax=Heliomarina sp. TaxID=2917556 RepID=UPI0040599969